MPRRERRGGPERERSEYDQKLLDVRRVARVVAGGRRFSFRVTVVIGNRRGKVAVAVAKGADVATAIEKATSRAKKHLAAIAITAAGSIAHEVGAKYGAARVRLWPRPSGSGIVAGGAVRAVVELAGIANISSKILSRTPNKLTNAMATLEALKQL
ncbi:MAG: 30S ribosomal protein S5 [Candidatus Sungbacteria bacterium]|uniref:Small ribosomal subunit protein uS5 n=1 Tax=Candidatus Sungiibacteriota bacterium TaxID=2750080 RepID=A0A932YVX4_9BACT|nr:30S ribosomal protein S5 [Candidatus Sungbacteria bacterium]